MATARNLIERSFRLLGTHAQGENPSAEEINDGLKTLIDMLDAWSLDSQKIHFRVKDEIVLTPGQSSYTFGVGGNINSARPTKIISARIKQNDQEYDVEIMDVEKWSKIPLKTTQGTLPYALYAEGTFPLETLNLYYVPAQANTLVLYSEKPISTLTLNSEISFPPAYAKALRYGLARDLAPEYGMSVSPEIERGYMEAMELIEQRNSEDRLMDADHLKSRRQFNIYTGRYD